MHRKRVKLHSVDIATLTVSELRVADLIVTDRATMPATETVILPASRSDDACGVHDGLPWLTVAITMAIPEISNAIATAPYM